MVRAFAGAFFLMFSQGVLALVLPLKVVSLGFDTKTSGMLLSAFGVTCYSDIFISGQSNFRPCPSNFNASIWDVNDGIEYAVLKSSRRIKLLIYRDGYLRDRICIFYSLLSIHC